MSCLKEKTHRKLKASRTYDQLMQDDSIIFILQQRAVILKDMWLCFKTFFMRQVLVLPTREQCRCKHKNIVAFNLLVLELCKRNSKVYEDVVYTSHVKHP